ncbi:MAG: SURF1 family protein [Microbacterium sp.]|nr:SURF1 family protein [Microbacterium sp.]
MIRPRWIAMLALCLVVAGVFAWLGQWQLGRAIDTAPVDPGTTEQIKPIDEVVRPGQYLSAPLVGQKVEVSGRFVADDFLIVTQRVNDGTEGYWVTGQFRLATSGTPTSLAVAVGWAPTAKAAERAVAELERTAAASGAGTSAPAQVLTGRIISDEGPAVPPRDRPMELTTMSPAALLGRWHDVEGLDVYRPYLTSAKPLGGLTAISSPAPDERTGVNWLNLFYAVEWAVFAGFAFYLWYRLAKDAWEKEVEEIQDAAAAASGP